MLKINSQKALYCLSLILFFYIYFSNSNVIIAAVKNSLFLCYSTVIPALFIFMVFAFYISHTNGKRFIGILFKPILKLINIDDINISSYVVLSVIGGFAVGGHFLALIQSNYKISKNALGVLSILMANNSPAFIIMAVGAGMLDNFKLGIMIFAAITISSLLTAFIFSFIFSFSSEIYEKTHFLKQSTFIDSISNSVKAMLNICGVVIIAFTWCKVISLYISNQYLLLLLTSLTEVTTACVGGLEMFGKDIYLFCAILALTPLSASLQIKSFFTENISLKILFLSRFLHIPLSILILKIIVNLFPYSAVVYSNTDNIVNVYWNSAPVSITFFIFCIIFIIFFDSSLNLFTKKEK